jgi:hypothetical protein
MRKAQAQPNPTPRPRAFRGIYEKIVRNDIIETATSTRLEMIGSPLQLPPDRVLWKKPDATPF